MDRTALERVVKIFAVDRGAVDQRCGGGRKRARMTDGGARAIVVAAGKRRFHIIFVARGDSEADHVDQQILALGPHRIGQARHIEHTNLLRQMLGNGDLGKFVGCHAGCVRYGKSKKASRISALESYAAKLPSQ